jgi:hypothetical protein
MIPAPHHPTGEFDPEFLEDLQDLIIRHEVIAGFTEPFPIDEIWDPSFLP